MNHTLMQKVMAHLPEHAKRENNERLDEPKCTGFASKFSSDLTTPLWLRTW
jgi:hypothetical protein